MVWEKNVYAIVMLTKCVEQGRVRNFYFLLLFRSFIHSYCGGGYFKTYFLKKTFPQALALLFLEMCFLSFSPLKVLKKMLKKKIYVIVTFFMDRRMFSIH